MVRCIDAQIFITMVVEMINYTYSERSFLSLFNDTMVILIGLKS